MPTTRLFKKDRAKTQTFVYFELDGVDACVGGVRELYSDSEGASCLPTLVGCVVGAKWSLVELVVFVIN